MDAVGAYVCPECSSQLVDDEQNGETVCSGCGMVVSDQMVDRGPESVGSTPEDRARQARATGRTTYSQHDLGIATSISDSGRDYSGKSISPEVRSQVGRHSKWQKRVRAQTPRERRVANVMGSVIETCRGASLPDNVTETAALIYRKLDGKVDVKGRSVAGMSAAVVFMACKQCGVIRGLEEVCAGSCQAKDAKARARLAYRYYREMVMELGPAAAPPAEMSGHISQIANKTRTDPRVVRLALDMADKTSGAGLADGKAPSGIAAAYLYVSSVLLGQSVLQRDVSGVAGVTEVTVRNRCKEMLTSYRLRLTLAPQQAGRP